MIYCRLMARPLPYTGVHGTLEPIPTTPIFLVRGSVVRIYPGAIIILPKTIPAALKAPKRSGP